MANSSWVDRLDFEPTKDHIDLFDGDVNLSDSDKFRIVSWNTLADQYVHYQQDARPDHDWIIFNKCRRHSELGKLFQKFVSLKVDFICLQEVDFKIARQSLIATHTRLLTPTGHGRGDTRVDACCIFFESNKWRLVGKEDIVDMDDLATKFERASSSSSTAVTKFQRTFVRGNFGIIACLENRRNGKKVIICNTHLHWNPKFEYVKLCQIHYFCLRLKNFLQRVPGDEKIVPIILCGDLNSQPGGPVHTYLSTGHLHNPAELVEKDFQSHMEVSTAGKWLLKPQLDCPFFFQSAYGKEDPKGHRIDKNGSSLGERMTLTNATADFTGVIDYIFVSTGDVHHSKRLFVPTVNEICSQNKQQPLLPTLEWPSDHLALGGEFYLFE